MKRKTRSILEELSSLRPNKDPELFVESRATHIIDSATNLIQYIREHFDEQTAYQLEKKFNSAIKSLDSSKFHRSVNRLKELKDVKNSLTVEQGDFQDDEE
jgi:hypothetical protein